MGRRPALRCIANLLCEQKVRLEEIGMDGTAGDTNGRPGPVVLG